MQNIRSVGGDLIRPNPEQVAHDRRGLWLASLIALGGLLLFVALFSFFSSLFGDRMQGLSLLVLGLFMSLVPAALWLYFFYRMDRLEAEPKHRVIQVFIFAVLVTAAIGQPVLERLFSINEWLYSSGATQLLGGIFLVGFVQEFVVYLVVRYSIFADPEFDERVDGVIYATAAGIGLATVLNFEYVLKHGGVDLDIGSVRMVVTSLGHASFAGVLGYFLGQARFEKTSPTYMAGGLALAALLNGLFFFLEDRVTSAGLQVNPWNGLLLAAIVAVITLAVVFWLVARANEETLRVAREGRRAPDVQPSRAAVAPPERPAAAGSEQPDTREANGSDSKDEGKEEV